MSKIVEDHNDLDEVLREAIFQDNTAQLKMRLPPAMKAVLSKLARQRTTDATTLARIWLAERLERELKRAESTNAKVDLTATAFTAQSMSSLSKRNDISEESERLLGDNTAHFNGSRVGNVIV